jgi:hypothetical protein
MAGQVSRAAQRRVKPDEQALVREEVDGREVDILLACAGDRDRVDRQVDLSALDGRNSLVGRQRAELDRTRIAEDRPRELMGKVDLEPGEPLAEDDDELGGDARTPSAASASRSAWSEAAPQPAVATATRKAAARMRRPVIGTPRVAA